MRKQSASRCQTHAPRRSVSAGSVPGRAPYNAPCVSFFWHERTFSQLFVYFFLLTHSHADTDSLLLDVVMSTPGSSLCFYRFPVDHACYTCTTILLASSRSRLTRSHVPRSCRCCALCPTSPSCTCVSSSDQFLPQSFFPNCTIRMYYHYVTS